MQYEPIIGLEIHIQAKTKSKMFSRVSAEYWGKPPNSCVDPVSLGLPGALPVPNKKAIEHCIKLSLALGCEINQETKFDRKNYFYPDLPKGYQISQYDQPIGFEGELKLGLESDAKVIKITRVHMEEDTGKSIHMENETLLDFNKAGVPLIEVVTEPDFRNGIEIDIFAKQLRQIVRTLGVSDADMEKGQMRYELNISLRKIGEKELPNYKVEIKNIGSISVLQKVLDFEVNRQKEILVTGKAPVQETRGVRDMTGQTYSQRLKEEANDYRYFPEPDIPPFHFTDEYLEGLKNEIPELPMQRQKRYMGLGIAEDIAETIINDEIKLNYLEQVIEFTKNDKSLLERLPTVAKFIISKLSGLSEEDKFDYQISTLPAAVIIRIAELRDAGEINSNTINQILEASAATGKFSDLKSLNDYINQEGLKTNTDESQVNVVVEKVIAAEPDAKERFKKNPKVTMYFVGQAMKELRGKGDAKVLQELIEKRLQELQD